MANSISQVVDISSPGTTRRSVDLLPALFRTDKNAKFLAGTLDQFIQPAQLERLNGWVGSRATPTYNPAKDNYITSNSKLRNAYQVAPALVVKDKNLSISKVLNYDDLINQLEFQGASVKKLDRLVDPQLYSYNPHIDWDKFVNFDQYYWMPNGPDVVSVAGENNLSVSTYTVSDSEDGQYFIFTPDGLTQNPLLTLYRGVTYIFNIQSSKKFWFKNVRIAGTEGQYRGVDTNGISNGKIIFKVDENTPANLFYVAEDSVINGGEILIKSLVDDSKIDVDANIIGKKTYTSGNGVVFTNGLRITFAGNVFPDTYADKEFFVEGVGDKIKLIDVATLETPEKFVSVLDENFDGTGFDDYGFDTFKNTPLIPEYITINRASIDRNPWSRYNRWFHEDVIIASAGYNNRPPVLPVENRGKRPIVEFEPNLQLFNFGSAAITNVQHIDTITTDAFSDIEGQLGYYVNGIEITQGDRIVFTSDTDPYVNSKIFVVNFVRIDGILKIALEEASDSPPFIGASIIVTKGVDNAGTNWWFNGTTWQFGQQKEVYNQAPLFDIFDKDEHSYGDSTYYQSYFLGSKVFGYSIGTGSNDSILGFPLKYKNIADQAFYLFENYFVTDLSRVVDFDTTYYLPISKGFIRKNISAETNFYINVWEESPHYTVPILQYEVIQNNTSQVEITSINNPAYQDVKIEVFLNNNKVFLETDYTLYAQGSRYFVSFINQLKAQDTVLIKVYGNVVPSETGYYDISIGWSNNPLNGPIEEFTLSELTDHAKSMADSHPDFVGKFLGKNNSRDIVNLSRYGSRLVRNKNPLSMAGYFIADKEHNIINAVNQVCLQYNQFKLRFLEQVTNLKGNYDTITSVDLALHNMNIARDASSAYAYADMLPYGNDVTSRQVTVTDSRNVTYGINSVYQLVQTDPRSVLVYHTPVSTGIRTQLLVERDYYFDPYDSTVIIKAPLTKGDVLLINDYASTDGSFVPPTPTKLGLYPKFYPEIFVDNTYATPQKVIQGHDGSIIVAFDDYRDDIILELERRIYNNIKVNYNSNLLDFNDIVPGAFRKTEYGRQEITNLIRAEFLRWNNFYGFDYENNNLYNDNPKTWNFKSGSSLTSPAPLLGNQRAIYKYFYDTDRPHTHPWEMLGFSIEPSWWKSIYGPAPYTSGNLILWDDLEAGLIRDPNGRKIDPKYARPGLLDIIPVDSNGNLLDPAKSQIVHNLNYEDISNNWEFGDWGPVETAWRRSSYWPFVAQIMAILAKPATYSSLLFDTSRVSLNNAGQVVYSPTYDFVTPSDLLLYTDTISGNIVRSAGYSVMLIETGNQKSRTYVADIKSELSELSMNLTHKVGGFVSKDKLSIVIDSVNPATANPGTALSNEDYNIFLDQSTPVSSLAISGIIVQRTLAGYVLRGYDKSYPFFTCLLPEESAKNPDFTVGGKSEQFVTWEPSSSHDTGLSTAELTTAVSSNDGYKFYRVGQVVKYNELYYRVVVSHTSGSFFNFKYFKQLPGIPSVGGITVSKPTKFATTETLIPYGRTYKTEQEVFNIIMGYGAWLESQGAIFDEFQPDLEEVLNWLYTGKEFLYWASQGWGQNTVITLSPFANSVKYKNNNGAIDNLGSAFYEYSVTKADGTSLNQRFLNVNRQDGVITVTTTNTTDGIFFIRFNCVQKEHTLVFNNYSLFNDTIYDVGTGYRQRRLQLNGFRTANWNGDLFSPGFLYDEANITEWAKNSIYQAGAVVRFAGNYYSAIKTINSIDTFDYNEWRLLGEKPISQLLPNFDYKINQFEDFYSLDIDNFDSSQQKLAQHLVGYTPRPYLDNIFNNPISQYKFYQGFIKEKGTRNTISKLGKASSQNIGSYVDYFEEWAFRIGDYGSYTTDKSIEITLDESKFKENPQIVKFVESAPINPNETYIFQTENDVVIKPTTYDNKPFATTSSIYADNIFQLPVAGYVRIDDVTGTAFNKSSLLDISGSLNDGDVVWIAYKDNGDWDVYRYTSITTRVVDASIRVPGNYVTLTTDYYHGLSVGDLISVQQFDTQLDGVHQILAVPELDQLVISSTLTTLSTPFSPAVGMMFKFVSSRFSNPDAISYLDSINRLQFGEKVWVDDDGTGRWAVYEKTDAYTSDSYTPGTSGITFNQRFSFKVVTNNAGTKVVSSAPEYYNSSAGIYGRVYAYYKSSTGTNNLVNSAGILLNISSNQTYYNSTDNPSFGAALALDDTNNFIAIGAPTTSYVKFTTSTDKLNTVSVSGTTSTYTQQGMVKMYQLNIARSETLQEFAVSSPQPQTGALFGSEIFIAESSTGTKLLMVASPGQDNESGAVHYSRYTVSTSNVVTISTSSQVRLPYTVTTDTWGDKFGTSIAGSSNGTSIAVAAPGYANGEGAVYVYAATNTGTFVNTQLITISSPGMAGNIVKADGFASKVLMDSTGKYLFVSAPKSSDNLFKSGKVFVFSKNESGTYLLNQIIVNPYSNNGSDFGSTMSLTPDDKSLVIASVGSNHRPYVTFDTYTKPLSGAIQYVLDPESKERESATTFDSGTVNFFTTVKNSGSVFTFTRLVDRYFYSQELFDNSIVSNQIYGRSIAASSNCIFVGAPGLTTDIGQTGNMFLFDYSLDTWNKKRYEADLVDISKIKSIKLINTEQESIVSYLQFIDPIKGKIPGTADSELKYKTVFDPAVYSIGLPGTTVDSSSSWIDDHVGELWWDLGSVKYVWYEQGELDFRKNNWATVFPGSTIDVYEWVGSRYLPSQWSSIAGTNEGLSQGISGQPKFPNNSVMSVKQVWDPITNTMSNIYYYWVKNKITIPSTGNRKLSSNSVANSIANPRAQGLPFIAPISEDAIILTNIKPYVSGANINLSIDIDDIDNTINKHTEWLLLQEGNKDSVPNAMLKKKVKDSILGRDVLGNIIPDPSLPDRLKYGVKIRPRQSIFKDRLAALRVLVEYANYVLKDQNIVDSTNLDFFNKKEEFPVVSTGLYDYQAEDVLTRDTTIPTRKLTRGVITASVANGKINTVVIENPGFGYGNQFAVEYDIDNNPILWAGPTLTITGTGTGAEIITSVNRLGEIVRATIKNPGTGFITAPIIEVRPFTVLVLADETVANRWSLYQWDYQAYQYIRAKTQSYNTQMYWTYVDWSATNFNTAQDMYITLESPYQLPSVRNITAGNYIKIKNAGDGRYIIIRKTNNSIGTYSNSYDLVYQEKGTIQISDELWKITTGFDYNAGYDQLLYDQIPGVEVENIIDGLDVIFSNNLKVYSNLLFFRLIKYAFAEQKFLDWAFKTSFISVINYAGSLDQRPTYKLNNETYYESYINETKPYHTKVRNFSVNYTATDVTSAVLTDFDCPPTFSTAINNFVPVTFGSSLLNTYPWKSWSDNYAFHLDSIEIYDGGSGYEVPPIVVFSNQAGDQGSGAEAVAYISLGKVTKIVVTKPGSGYTATPVVTLLGGGPTTLTPAKVGIRMTNGLVRSSLIKMKFDRVSGYNEIDTVLAEDNFTTDGYTNTYKLTWAPNADKNNITVKLDGIKVLSDSYSVKTWTEKFAGYSKKYGSITLSTVPNIKSVVTVIYEKDISLFNAVDRIVNFYQPEVDMPGNTATILMAGLEYPGVTIDTLPLESSTGFDSTPFATNNWDDFSPEEGLYETVGSASTTMFTLGYIPAITSTLTVYKNNIRLYGSTVTNTLSNVLQLVNGLVIPDGTKNRVNIFTTSSSTDVISFRLETSDGSLNVIDLDLDMYLSGGDPLADKSLGYGYDRTIPTGPDDLEDIVIDGDSLVSTWNSYGPEENLPGRVSDTVGISVYTMPPTGSAMATVRKYITQSGQTRYSMGATPPTSEYVEVLYNGQLLSNYTIDYTTNEIVFGYSLSSGVLSIRVLSVGGTNLIEKKAITITTATTKIETSVLLSDIRDSYITVNGIKKTLTTHYTVTGKLKSGTAGRGIITFTTPLSVGDVVQIWLFASAIKSYSEVRRQTTSTIVGQTVISLDYPPTNIQPYHNQVIVEKDGKRLSPPDTQYYTVMGNETSFLFNGNYDYPIGYPDRRTVEVYVNGRPKQFAQDFEFIQSENRINFVPGVLNSGDVVAISILIGNDYIVSGNKLIFSSSVNTAITSTVNVYTFSNHDASLIRKERFPGNPGNTFTLSRPALDTEYLWVELNGNPLMRELDYVLLNDHTTIQISDNIILASTDTLTITSVVDVVQSTEIIGYRMFMDNLGRTHYKRLSKDFSTSLAQPLTSTATTIQVTDSTVLTPPNPEKYLPGIILINGERIEFYKITGNTLSAIKRGTLGTGVGSYTAGTTVIDQGTAQTMTVSDRDQTQRFKVISSTTTWKLSQLTFNSSIPVHEQIDVYYRGKLLRKPTTATYIITDGTIAYDSNEINSTGISSNTILSAEFTATNTGTLVLGFSPAVGSELKVVRRISDSWFDTLNTGTVHEVSSKYMHENTTEQVKFLLERPSALPDKYYYGK